MKEKKNHIVSRLPIARKTEQKRIVSKMKAVFQSCWSLTVLTPKNMKMMVSELLLSIFMAYLMVVCDLGDMLPST